MQNNQKIKLNSRSGWLGWWPEKGLKAILDPENARIEKSLIEQSTQLPKGALILDAGAGKCPYTNFHKSKARS